MQFRLARPEHTPSHILFPEQYEESKRMVARDFTLFGASIVLGVLVVGLVLRAASF